MVSLPDPPHDAIVALPGDDDVVAAIAMDVGVDADAAAIVDDRFGAVRAVDDDLRLRTLRELARVRERDHLEMSVVHLLAATQSSPIPRATRT